MSQPEGQAAQAVASGNKEQFLTIQALRFVAAFAVVILHCSFYTVERLDPSMGIYTSGANGVRLFFVISGFVMVASSHRLEGTPYGWRVFAARRVMRIVPMYWVITTVKLAILLVAPTMALHSHLDWSYILKSYAFIPALNEDAEIQPLLGVGWTLNFEMFFYLLFTIALIFRTSPLLLITPILIGLSLSSAFRTSNWPIPLQFWADPIVLDFVAGMIIAKVTQSGVSIRPFFAWAFVIMGLSYLFLPISRVGTYGTFEHSLSLTVACLLVIGGASQLENHIGAAVPPWLRTMGATSYALYLIHPITAPIVPSLFYYFSFYYPAISIVLSIILSLFSGILVYGIIEYPLTRISRKPGRRRKSHSKRHVNFAANRCRAGLKEQ